MAQVTISELCLLCQKPLEGKYGIYIHVVELERNKGSVHWRDPVPGRVKLNYTMKKPRGLVHIDCMIDSSFLKGVSPD